MSDTFSIGLVQNTASDNPQQNLAAAKAGIEEAARRGAQIVCLQELFKTPYFCSVEDTERFSLAEPIPGPSTNELQSLAAQLQVALVVSLFERRAPGVYHNSAAVIDADGSLLGIYRKMHIPDDPLYYEKFYFAPGDVEPQSGGYQVFSTRYAKIGVLICWDQWYPEAARITSLLGAEVLFYPTAIGWHPSETPETRRAELEAWQTIQRSHAIANGVYVAAVNRGGHEATAGTDGLNFYGRSFVCAPNGQLLTEAPDDKSTVLVAECQRSLSEESRRLWPFLRDRRIDSYAPICSRWLEKENK